MNDNNKNKLSKPFKYEVISKFITSPNSSLAICLLNEQLKIVFANHSFLEITKLSLRMTKGKNIKEYLETNNEFNFGHLIDTLKKNRVITAELKNCYREQYFEGAFSKIKRTDENEDLILLILHEITEKKLIINKLSVQQAYLEALIKNAPIGIVILDSEFRIEQINNEFSNMFGYQLDEIKGKELPLIISPSKFINETKELVKRISGGETVSLDTIRKRKNKTTFNVNISATKVHVENSVISFIILFKDITLQKIIEKEIIKTKEESERVEKMKSNFIAQISHEIRTPLNLVMSSTSLIKDILEDTVNPEVKELFGIIDEGGQRIIRTIDLILNMSELESGGYNPVKREINIDCDILQQIVSELSILAKRKNLSIDYKCLTVNPVILTDTYSLSQIIINLLDNAIKYTERGKISLRLLKDRNNKYNLEISDTGIGISKKFVNNMYSPFSQEESGYRRSYDGTGLGLSLVKKYCDVIGASIKVKTKKGVGTKFSIILN